MSIGRTREAATRFRRAVVLAALLLAGPAHAGGVVVAHAWIGILPGDFPASAYCVVANDSGRPQGLTAVHAPVFRAAMLHRSVTRDGLEKTVPVARVVIPAGWRFRFAPGGYHIMLMPPHTPLRPDTRTRLTFRFRDGSRTSASFLVKGAGTLSGD